MVGAGVDQLPGIHGARRDHAVEGRVDLLESLKLLQPLQVGLRGFHRRGRGGRLADEVIRILLRNRIRCDQSLVALGLRLGVARVRPPT